MELVASVGGIKVQTLYLLGGRAHKHHGGDLGGTESVDDGDNIFSVDLAMSAMAQTGHPL